MQFSAVARLASVRLAMDPVQMQEALDVAERNTLYSGRFLGLQRFLRWIIQHLLAVTEALHSNITFRIENTVQV